MEVEAEVEVRDEGNAGDDIAAAWDTLEVDSGEEKVQHTEASGAATDSGEPQPADNTSAAVHAEGVHGADSAVQPVSTEAEETPTPVGLSEDAKAEWTKVPKAVQDAVYKREKDFARGIQRYAEGAQRAQAMDQALQPFQQFFAMSSQPVGQQVTGLLQTATLLQMGTPQQRAQTVANIIQQFGVDIDTLDRMLVGEKPAPEVEVKSQVQQQIDQALAPYRQREQWEAQQRQGMQQEMVSQATQDINVFSADPRNEFYLQVRSDMADILEMNSNRGVEVTLQEAYRRACLLNPQIQTTLSARASTEIANKKKAAASISGNPGGSPSNSVPDSLRGAIEQAWGNYENG